MKDLTAGNLPSIVKALKDNAGDVVVFFDCHVAPQHLPIYWAGYRRPCNGTTRGMW